MPPELPKIEKPPVSLATQSEEERERDNLALAEVEKAKKSLFYRRHVEASLDLDQRHRTAIAEAMAKKKRGTWDSYDGEDVTVSRIQVVDNVIVITFSFFDGMNFVDEKVEF